MANGIGRRGLKKERTSEKSSQGALKTVFPYVFVIFVKLCLGETSLHGSLTFRYVL